MNLRDVVVEKVFREEILILAIFFLFIIVRIINFPYHLNFSTDQGLHSSAALDVYKNKSPVLVGPRFSLEYDGRFMFTGPYFYYLLLLMLLMGNFDPINSSFAFVVFSGLMLIPLFYGTKKLINRNAAFLFVAVYSFLPYFVNYTKFLWNPNFQFVLLPILVLLMGLFKENKGSFNFFLLSVFSGVLLFMHYSFLVIILGLLLYYFVFIKIGIKYLGLFVLGILASALPILVFELRNNFYNLNTFMIFLRNFNDVFITRFSGEGSKFPHYYLSVSFFGFLLAIYLIRKKINKIMLIAISLFLLSWSFLIYIPKPSHGYGMAKDWNYLKEAKANQIIVEQHLSGFNVSNLVYDTRASVQKYLLKKEDVYINEDDYKGNNYLFVITDRDEFLDDPAYEVKSFNHGRVLKSWDIDGKFKVYLAERL